MAASRNITPHIQAANRRWQCAADAKSSPRLLGVVGRLDARRHGLVIYALVLVPSLRELLPRSDIAATKVNGWQLAALRLLAGIGIGGEWTMGGTFVAEVWPEHRRIARAGFMQQPRRHCSRPPDCEGQNA